MPVGDQMDATSETVATDEQAPTEPVQQQPTGDDSLPPAVKQILSENRKALRDAERRAKHAETKAREFEDRDKTELERAQSKADEATRELAQYKQRALAQTVAIEAGIPEWWERLKGADEDQLRADAKELSKRLGGQPRRPTPDLGAGARGTEQPVTDTQGFSNLIREKARS